MTGTVANMVRRVAATMIALSAMAAAAADRADVARGTIAISASVAGQARLTGEGARSCLWSNSATRLLAVAATGPGGVERALTPAGGIVAAAAPGCVPDAAIVATGPAGGRTRTLLIAPQ